MNNFTQFSYDGLWRNTKIVETVSGSVTSTRQFIWSGARRKEERDGGGTLVSRFFRSGHISGGNNYLYCLDHLGSVREVTTSGGSLSAQFDYSNFGQRNILVSSTSSDYGFTGFFIHARSGLNLPKYRQYNSSIGRWMSRDPIYESSGTNLYAYSDNNPENYYDSLGLLCECSKNCKEFVECLVKLVAASGTSLGGQGSTAGKSGGMKTIAESAASSKFEKNLGSQMISGMKTSELAGSAGFKGQLTMGGQNGGVGMHIMGSAGYSLWGGSGIGAAAASYQSATDIIQIFTKSDHLFESIAEISDNAAGQQVAQAIRDFYDSTKSKDDAMKDLTKKLMDLLCEGDGTGK